MMTMIWGMILGAVLVFAVGFTIAWIISSRTRKDFTLEYQKDNEDDDNNASAGSLVNMLKKCPKDATVTFGVYEGGDMRIRVDNVVDYNASLNEVVMYPFDRPSDEGGYKDMIKKQDPVEIETDEKTDI